jgi:hypothetical protein
MQYRICSIDKRSFRRPAGMAFTRSAPSERAQFQKMFLLGYGTLVYNAIVSKVKAFVRSRGPTEIRTDLVALQGRGTSCRLGDGKNEQRTGSEWISLDLIGKAMPGP